MVQWLWEEGREEDERREGGVCVRKRRSQRARDQSMLWPYAPPTLIHKYCMPSTHTPQWEISTVIWRVKSQAGSLCVCVCVRDRDKWASLCDRQQRDSVTLYVTSLPYPDACTHTQIHTHQGGRGCTARADRKQGHSSPPLHLSFSLQLPLFPSIPLFNSHLPLHIS